MTVHILLILVLLYNVQKIVNSCTQYTQNGACCVFPFFYEGQTISECIPDFNGSLWCATTFNYDDDLQWDYCLANSLSSWSDWSNWSECSSSCGTGITKRTRMCLDSTNSCVESSSDVAECYSNQTCTANSLSSWSDWSNWSECSSSCGTGITKRTRMCLDSTNSCVESSTDEAECYSNQTCTDPMSSWSDWGSWSYCSVTCGSGTMKRTRICFGTNGLCVGNTSDIIDCSSNQACTANSLSSWSDWSNWSECSSSCGTGITKRTRICLDSTNFCVESSTDEAECYSSQTCTADPMSSWSDWGSWSYCSVTCGSGIMKRTRICFGTNGLCVGNTSDIIDCSSNQACTANSSSSWSDWSNWSECSSSCGTGITKRTRICLDSTKSCVESSTDEAECYSNQTCTANSLSSWSDWSNWSECSSSCGTGITKRTRICLDSTKSCVESSTDEAECYSNQTCTANSSSSWSDWSNWSECTSSCGTGITKRTRVCLDSTKSCVESSTDEAECYSNQTCTANSLSSWSDWSNWSECSSSCGTGITKRTRICLDSTKSCVESSTDEAECYSNQTCTANSLSSWSDWSNWSECTSSCGTGITKRTRVCLDSTKSCVESSTDEAECYSNQTCTANSLSSWSDWSNWSECTSSCGTGITKRTRVCLDSTKSCVESSTDEAECYSNQTCTANSLSSWSDWSNWSECSSSCGTGITKRTRICLDSTKSCVESSTDEAECYSNQTCTANSLSSWSDWSNWSECTSSCGTGITKRTRVCLDSTNLCVESSTDEAKCYSNQTCTASSLPNWSDWSSWSECTSSCGTGITKRTRVCLDSTNLCVENSTDEAECYSNQTCTAISMSSWSDWGKWSNCTVTCGVGVMNRTRMCLGSIDLCEGNTTDITDCSSNQTCTANTLSNWSDWSSWSNCSVSCGDGTKNRTRMCLDPVKSCLGNTTDITDCYSNLTCAANTLSNWSDWSSWSNCSVSCGDGTKNRTRMCLDPVKSCLGNTTDITDCYSNLTCAAISMSSWSDWGNWSNCTVTCGVGVMNRTRMCLGSIDLCEGNTTDITDCSSNQTCTANTLSNWSDWSSWSNCSVSCGDGTKNRTRMCLDPVKSCLGNTTDITDCYSNLTCAAISMSSWSDWGNWSNCTVTCGVGVMNRTRMCLGSIDLCEGNTTDITDCSSNQTCTANTLSNWSDWSSWSNCSVSCGDGTKNRTRMCLDPVKSCLGNTTDITDCYSNLTCAAISMSSWSDWGNWSNCTVTCGVGVMNRTRMCLGSIDLCEGNTTDITDCSSNQTCTANTLSNWSDWSSWSNCSVSCGDGTKNRTRMCLDPVKSCLGNTTDITDCYSNLTCAAISMSSWSDWGNWSNCTVTCGVGVMNRTRMCLGSIDLCEGNTTDITDCSSNQTCTANTLSNWSDWSSWSNCSVSCGDGTKNRTRMCLDPVKSCLGNTTDITDCYSNLTCAANSMSSWSDWGNWSNCTVTCGVGVMNRTRMCLGTIDLCEGNTTDITDCSSNQTCIANPISNWSDWSSWSNCTVSCGGGTKNRTRMCLVTIESCIGNNTDVSDCYSNQTCKIQCEIISQIEKYLSVPENVFKDTNFDFVFVLQKYDLHCLDNSVINLDDSLFSSDISDLSWEFDLYFGDGKPLLSKQKVNSNSSLDFLFTYNYGECGKYTIEYIIKPFSGMYSFLNAEIFDYVNITVFCKMSSVKLVSNSTSETYPKVPLEKELTFLISQDLGSFIIYTVDWGDNVVQLIDQSQKKSPLPFVLSHTYKNAANYTVNVIAKNALQVTSSKIIVQVLDCSFPKITFQYGTLQNPLKIFNAVKEFVAYVDVDDNDCLLENISIYWILTGSNMTNKSQGVLKNSKIVYSLKGNLDYGSYIISLYFSFNMFTNTYISYFMVVDLPLYIEIDNGEFRTVAYKQTQNGNISFQNLKITALVSSDGSQPKIKYQGFVYEWKCRIVSNISFALNSLIANKMVNSNLESNTCFNESWMDITVDGPELVFNTHMFLEGIRYQFQVIGTNLVKNSQSNSFIQEVMISPGELPNGTINCVTNCAEKLNIKDHVIFQFACLNCDETQLSYIWEVLNDDGEWPEELLQENSTTTGFKNSYLVINVETLLASKSYTFTLKVGYIGSFYKALFNVKKQTSSLPSSGSCFISPQQGYAFITKFKLICQDWKDNENSVLTYKYFYDNGAAEGYTMTTNEHVGYPLLNAKSLEDPILINFVLGPGNINKNFSVTIIIKIVGIYKAFIQYPDLFVQVLPFEKNISTLLADIKIPDILTFSSVLHAISHLLNYYSNTVKLMNPVITNNITGFTEPNDNVILNKQSMLVQLQYLRTSVVDVLLLQPIKSLMDLKDVGDVLSIVLSVPDELNLETKTNAVDIITKMSSLLTEENIKNIGPHIYDQITQPFIFSISHLFSAIANSNSAIFNSSNIVESVESGAAAKDINYVSEQAKINLVTKLIRSMEEYFNGLQYYLANNENPTIVDTPAFKYFVKKVYGNSYQNIWSKEFEVDFLEENYGEQSGFKIQNLTSLLNESTKYSSIVINNLNLKSQTFSWDLERSNNIVSENQILYLSTTSRKKIEVKNLTSTIDISIKNIPEKMIGQNISLPMPNNVQMNFINISSAECKLMMKFAALNDPQNKTNLIVYIQYGKVPTIDDYDIKLNISNRDGTDLIIGNNTPHSNSSVNIQRSQKRRLLKDGSIILWDFHNSTYSFLNKKYLYLSYFYVGPMPEKILESNLYTFDGKEFYGTFLYEMKSFCVECNYWNESNNKWMSDGCEIDLLTTTFYVTKCKCNHLTAFGGFYVAPNILPTPSLSLLKVGYTLLVVVITVIGFWIAALVFARRADINDVKKVGVCPLIDNFEEDCYLYEITVITGSRINAGTKSNIFFKVAGEFGDSGNRHLNDSQRVCFQRSSVDVFIMATTKCLGELNYIQLWHDNSGGGWYLRDIEIVDLQTEQLFYFIANRWIAIDKDNCSLDVVLPVSSRENITNFNYIFYSNVRKGFTDEHLWLSVLTRLPISNFTRCQRISVSVCLLMTSMTASAMFFEKVPPSSPATENRIGAFSFTIKQLYVGIVCTFITLPINILLTQLFRLVQPVYQQNMICGQSKYNDLKFESIEDGFQKKAQVKKLFYFPHWFLYISWFICIATILGLGYVILLYGMSFGNKKSLDWLASISLGLIHDVIVMQPIKIFVFSILAALASKAIISKERYMLYMRGKMLACNENWLHSTKNKEAIVKRIDDNRMPPPASLIESMKAAHLKEVKMQTITRELLVYILFSIVVFYLGYISRGSFAYYQTHDIEELFNLKLRSKAKNDKFKVFETLRSSDDFWPWMDSFFLALIHPDSWFIISDLYKGNKNIELPGKVFLPDLVSKVITGIRIRQVRVKTDTCIKANEVSELFNTSCLSDYKIKFEEVQDFDFNWEKPKIYNSSITSLTMPWRYQTSEELNGYPLSATLEVYNGGGYVLEVFPKWKNKEFVKQLKQKKWIDRQTRALIIEFALFNAATNHFTMVTIVFEFPSFGGMVPYYDVASLNLYVLTSENSVGTIIFQIIFLLLMFIFTIREFKMLYRRGWHYFYEFWNVIEAALVVLSILAVVFFIYKVHLVEKLIGRLPEKQPQKFINFQFVSYWDSIYNCIVSLLVFFVSLKFLKLLRFNHRVSVLSSTLKVAFFPLSMLGITFVLALCAIISFSTISFGVLLDGYQTYLQTISSVIFLLLGKFSYYSFVNASPVLGPLFFLGFNIFMIWILMNMFISILNDCWIFVHQNKDFQNNDYEMVDYFLTRFQGWFGLNTKNNSKHLSSSGSDCVRKKSEILNSTALSCEGLSHCLKNCNTTTIICVYNFDENVIEQEDKGYMNKVQEKFIKCVHILQNRNFIQAS
ncbi:uncharacterized protein LOC100203937 isoform X7 [Hydra vulgaris]|uniref:uncharacterized protein LOC100203937 isoform X7 n=1 Tax=Hydra vulgaris TaxID=6087 RepID=UPI0032E9BFD1